MIRRPPLSTRLDTRFPDATLFRLRLNDPRGEPDLPGSRRGRIMPGSLCPANPSARAGPKARFRPPAPPDPCSRIAWRVPRDTPRSEEHTSELQSLMRISYAVFCLKKKKKINPITTDKQHRQ